ncbi:HlyD family type I secretion periplasmic adaptor subunit [Xanthobacter sp. V4C-4]|uniref:HlyD family type I secretion periplasmic adaptor subunit n=1 Tax=Xanthobacter cornucopiae TaxID=3119924 RepID=UPI003728F2EB
MSTPTPLSASTSTPDPAPDDAPRASLDRLAGIGFALVGLLVASTLAWGVLTRIDSAVVTQGDLVVDTHVKKIQHVAGGAVAEIRVKEGDRVETGDVLVVLDDTALRAQLGVVSARAAELTARRARLESEIRGDAMLVLPPDLEARRAEPVVAAALRSEEAAFASSRAAEAGLTAQIGQQVAQYRKQAEGFRAQLAAKHEEIALAKEEMDSLDPLIRKGLIARPRYLALQRTLATAEGETGRIAAAIAGAEIAAAEAELRLAQVRSDTAARAAGSLAEIQGELSTLAERRTAAEHQLAEVEVRAPQGGRVHELAVHARGAVVQPGGVIMSLVPSGDVLVAETRVAPGDIDQVRLGAPVFLRLRAGNQRLLPAVSGTVTRVAEEVSVDTRTGQSFYTVRTALDAATGAALGDLKLVSGMPVDAFITTGSRSPAAFMLEPLTEQIAYAWRER